MKRFTAGIVCGLVVGAMIGLVAGGAIQTATAADMTESNREAASDARYAAAVGVVWGQDWKRAALACVKARFGNEWERLADQRRVD